jgi:hypothetical protein
VDQHVVLEQQPARLQVLGQQLVRVLDVQADHRAARDAREIARELALGVDGIAQGQAPVQGDPVVVLAERRRLVDDAGAVLNRDVSI